MADQQEAAPTPASDVDAIIADNLADLRSDSKQQRAQTERKYLEDWTGMVIMGSFVPAIFALVVVFVGQVVINSETGRCDYNIKEFLSASVAIGYLYLLIFTWIFLGDEIRIPKINIPILLPFASLPILLPFTSLKWVVAFFSVIGIMSFITNCVGTYLLISGFACSTSAPVLHGYASFVAVAYWIGIFVFMFALIKVVCGKRISATLDVIGDEIAKGAAHATSGRGAEEGVFRSKFDQFDSNKTNNISRKDLRDLVAACEIPLSFKKRSELADKLDPDGTGFLAYAPLFDWYKESLKDLHGKLGRDDDEEEYGEGKGNG